MRCQVFRWCCLVVSWYCQSLCDREFGPKKPTIIQSDDDASFAKNVNSSFWSLSGKAWDIRSTNIFDRSKPFHRVSLARDGQFPKFATPLLWSSREHRHVTPCTQIKAHPRMMRCRVESPCFQLLFLVDENGIAACFWGVEGFWEASCFLLTLVCGTTRFNEYIL